MLASGDEFELFEIARGYRDAHRVLLARLAHELDPLLQQYGQNILKLYTPDMLAPVSINGKVIAVRLTGERRDGRLFSVPRTTWI